jgi:hypothetical protein
VADPNGQIVLAESYVVFGSSGGFVPTQPQQSQRSNGFKINGIDTCDDSGSSVSEAGDVNGDGFDDLYWGCDAASQRSKVCWVEAM